MSIRLIASDLDGTLLPAGGSLSERTLRVLERCAENGILFLPATGRSLEAIPAFLREHPALFRYVMTANGARTYDLKEEKTIDEALIGAEKVRAILEQAGKFRCTWRMYLGGSLFTECHDPDTPGFSVPEGTKNPPEGQMEFLRRRPETKIEKMELFFERPEERALALGLFGKDPELSVGAAFSTNLEFNCPEGNKGGALARFAAMFGIRKEEILSFGDGTNDVPMFSVSGIGAAMENAPQEVKDAANYLAGKDREDGVAKAIEALVF